MGNNATSRIVYGIQFEEDYEFPWSETDGDIEDWWVEKICGYKPPFEIFNEFGEFLNGIEPPEEKIDEYFEHKGLFQQQNPLPVAVENYCNYDQPMYIIALPKRFAWSEWGEPEIIEPSKLAITEEERQTVIDFCGKYCQPQNDYDKLPEMNPQFYLISFWG
jgi:hypothetical protein